MSKPQNRDKKEHNLNFAEAMAELESITEYLESDDVEIDKAMEKFKRGSELAKEIKNYLKEAENTISTIKADL